MTEFKNIAKDFKEMQDKFKDPVVVGAMLHTISEEKASQNLLLKEINAKLDRLETRLTAVERRGKERREILSETDEAILAFVRKRGKATAEAVRKRFGYRGRNAASARMNALARDGLLEKKRAGRKVFFLAT